MNLYNHLSKKINAIGKTNEPINMYVCGSTVHATSHIGHGRTFSIFDSMRKYLVSKGKVVNYGMNVTDIDDKINMKVRLLHYYNIINCDQIQMTESMQNYFRSNRLDKINPKTLESLLISYENIALEMVKNGNLTTDQLTPQMKLYKSFVDEKTQKFWDEMELINVEKPTVVIRVSDVIKEIIDMIDNLIQKGFAYESNGSVYFNTNYYHKNFFKCELSNSTEDDVNLKDEHTSDKINSQDFALWKKAKPYSISFDSKWGPGTVGWHIECSLMSSMMFGNNIDFHGGGIDLKFPHHHNEVLQSNSYYGIDNVFKHFSYVGHVCVSGEKMAQSVGNYLSLEDYLKVNSPNSMRLLFWLSLWSNPVDLTDELIDQAKILENRIGEFLSNIDYNLTLNKKNLNDYNKINEINNLFNDIDNLLSNEFKTPEAISKFNEIMTQTNIGMKNCLFDNSVLKHILTKTINLLDIVGYKITKSNTKPDESFESNVINELLELRKKLRDAKQYNLSDYIRDTLFPNIGFQVQDMKDGIKIKKNMISKL